LALFAAALPWEYRQRGLGWEAAQARWQMEAGAAASTASLPGVGLLLSSDGDCEEWLRTLGGWMLQTAPTRGWWVVGNTEEPWRSQRQAAGLPAPQGCVAQVDVADMAACGVDWALSAQAGDLLHPSLALTIALAARDGREAVCWDWLTYDEAREGVRVRARHRAPWRDMVRELTTDTRGRSFALPIGAWEGYPAVGVWRLRMGLDARQANTAVCHHPEPLSMLREHRDAPERPGVPHAQEVAQNYWRAPFHCRADGHIEPAVAAGSVTVVVMYRDRPELTTRALQSVLSQRFEGDLEVVLVDNGSSAATRSAMDHVVAQAHPRVRFNRLDAPGAFNHSAQAKFAADSALGEVLVWLNNDACLLGDDALDQLARWARLPRVASVGASVVDAAGNVVGGGMRARRTPGAEFNSPVEEASGAEAAHARQAIGNSFACAAVSAVAWRALGGLDASRFPAGYNDVDYCLRAVSQGWTHVNLGHVRILHAVGASRAKMDEIAQKTWLRTQYPWTTAFALQESTCERIDGPAARLPAIGPARAQVEVMDQLLTQRPAMAGGR